MGWQLVVWIVSLIVSELLRPKLKSEGNPAEAIDRANMPTATPARPIPVVWGKVRLRDPNLVWYGDYVAQPIIVKLGQGGAFGTGKSVFQTVGYKYHIGQHLALCHGPANLHKLWLEERELFDVSAATAIDFNDPTDFGGSTAEVEGLHLQLKFVDAPAPFDVLDGSYYVDARGLYGGQDRGGGFGGIFRFYAGDNTHVADSYLQTRLGSSIPTFRGVSSIVFEGPSGIVMADEKNKRGYFDPRLSGYIGTSPTPHPISAEVSRYPDSLVPAKAQIGEDANPAEVLYEILTSDPNGPDGWGMGLDAGLIDLDSFTAAANQLHSEGFGISLVWGEKTALEEILAEVCRTIDATCFRDYRNGKWKLTLIRGGYNQATLPVFDKSNAVVESFAQSTIDGTANEVQVTWADRSKAYQSAQAQAQDMANMRQQGEVISYSASYPGITTAALAERVAQRELRALGQPLAKLDIVTNRDGRNLQPGDLFVFDWEPLGISDMVFRVVKSAIGMPTANRIRISAVHDVFSLAATAGDTPGDEWEDPVPAPTPITLQRAEELPYYLTPADQLTTEASYQVNAAQPNVGCLAWDAYALPDSDIHGGYRYVDGSIEWTSTAPLDGAIGWADTSLTIGAGTGLQRIGGIPDSERRQGANIAVFATGEWISYGGVTDNGDGTRTLTDIWRGLFDTVPVDHMDAERLWFVNTGAIVGQWPHLDTLTIKAVPTGPKGGVALVDATGMTLNLVGRAEFTLPPGLMRINGMDDPTTTIGDATATWATRVRTRDQVINQDDPSQTPAENQYRVQVFVGGAQVVDALQTIGAEAYVYTAEQRILDSTDGTETVEIKVAGDDGASVSAYNSAGDFTMTGFGMTYGLYYGGIEG